MTRTSGNFGDSLPNINSNIKKRIGVLTSGGDAPGMNAAIRAVVLTANSYGIECVGIRRGYAGLISGDVTVLSPRDVGGAAKHGGTMLFTARSPEFMLPENQKRAADNCKFLGLSALVVIGGDGSFHGGLALHKLGVAVACIPGTIDNDIGCTSYTIGFDTALNTAVEAVDRLDDTMQSHERCSVVEVMGHRTGFLALQVGIATGALVTLVPERDIDFETDVIARIRSARLAGRTHFTVIVAEGASPFRKTDCGAAQIVTSAHEIAGRIVAETGVETRVTTLGHLQRGGTPNARDRVTATRMGSEAVKLLAAGQSGFVVVMDGDECRPVEVETALGMAKSLDTAEWDMQEQIGGI
jgi:6-phosphofructokinase 1